MSKKKESAVMSDVQAFSTLDDWAQEGEVSPDLIGLRANERIRGKLVGPGQTYEFKDSAGDTNSNNSWRIMNVETGVLTDIKSSSNLDKYLPELVGSNIGIARLGQEETRSGNRVNVFKIVNFDAGRK